TVNCDLGPQEGFAIGIPVGRWAIHVRLYHIRGFADLERRSQRRFHLASDGVHCCFLQTERLIDRRRRFLQMFVESSDLKTSNNQTRAHLDEILYTFAAERKLLDLRIEIVDGIEQSPS